MAGAKYIFSLRFIRVVQSQLGGQLKLDSHTLATDVTQQQWRLTLNPSNIGIQTVLMSRANGIHSEL